MKKIEESEKPYQDMSDIEYKKGRYPDMTNEEYREKIFEIFREIDENSRLRFWYRYISAIEKGED